MSIHRPVIATDEIYHVFNRTIGKERVFHSDFNLDKFFEIVDYYRYHEPFRLSRFRSLPYQTQQELISFRKKKTPLVEIYAFSFMPNHFHFLLKQLKSKGISCFMSNVQNSFAKYYNLKNYRDGGLFQSSFKAKLIHTTEEFIHVSRYIHLNPVTAKILDFQKLKTSNRTSFSIYLDKVSNLFVNKTKIRRHFIKVKRHISFVKNQINYQRTLKKIKKLLLD